MTIDPSLALLGQALLAASVPVYLAVRRRRNDQAEEHEKFANAEKIKADRDDVIANASAKAVDTMSDMLERIKADSAERVAGMERLIATLRADVDRLTVENQNQKQVMQAQAQEIARQATALAEQAARLAANACDLQTQAIHLSEQSTLLTNQSVLLHETKNENSALKEENKQLHLKSDELQIKSDELQAQVDELKRQLAEVQDKQNGNTGEPK